MNSSSKLLCAGGIGSSAGAGWTKFLTAGAVLLGLAAPAPARVMEDTVAVVNGAPILLSDFQKEIDEVMDYWRRAMPAAAAGSFISARNSSPALKAMVLGSART
jgi:hypothetical protein